MDAFLDHHVDEVFFIAFHDDSKEQQCRCLPVGHAAVLDEVHFASDQEVATSVHEHLGVDLWRICLEHETCVEHRNGLEAQRERATECQELEVDLAELNVEFPKVSDVVKEEALAEVRLDELILQRVFVRAKQILKRIQSDFVLLYIRINEDHAFYTVVDAMSDKVKLKEQLFAKDEPEVSFTEQLVDERVVGAHKLVLDVLQDAADVRQREDFVLALELSATVLFIVECQIFHWRHLVLL